MRNSAGQGGPATSQPRISYGEIPCFARQKQSVDLTIPRNGPSLSGFELSEGAFEVRISRDKPLFPEQHTNTERGGCSVSGGRKPRWQRPCWQIPQCSSWRRLEGLRNRVLTCGGIASDSAQSAASRSPTGTFWPGPSTSLLQLARSPRTRNLGILTSNILEHLLWTCKFHL